MSLWARCVRCGQYQPDPEGNGSAGLHHCPGPGRPHISDAEDPAAVFERFVSATQGPRLPAIPQDDAERDTQRAIHHTATLLDEAFRATDRYPEGLIGDLLFLILGPEDRRQVAS